LLRLIAAALFFALPGLQFVSIEQSQPASARVQNLTLELEHASAISLEISPGPDTHLRSDDRFGTGTPSADCPSGYTCTALGTTQECTVDDGSTQVFAVRNASDTAGLCPAIAAFVSETNWHFELDIVTVSGGGQYAGGGSVISQSDGDFSTPDPKSYCWYSDGRVRMKYDAGRAGQVSAVSTATFTPSVGTPLKIGTEYTAASNSYRCGYLIAGEFFQVGTTQTALAFNSGVRGAMSTAYSTSSTATVTTDNWEDSTTLDPYVDEGEPEPDPDPESDTPDYTDQRTTLLGGRTVVPVANNAGLGTAITSLVCGQTLELATGTYSTARTIDTTSTCPANFPVIVRAATGATPTITNLISLRGEYIVLGPGLTFSGESGRVFCGGTNNSIIGNRASGFKSNWVQMGDGTNESRCEVAYNEMSSPATPWPGYSADYFRQVVKAYNGSAESSVHDGAYIHHNYFHHLPNKPVPSDFGSGDADAIEFGESAYSWTSTHEIGWYIEWNLFENLGQTGQAVIDAKVGGYVIRYNTIQDADNTRLDARVGPGGVIESNWMELGGSTVHSSGHILCGNRYGSGPGIKLHMGEVEWNATGSGHQRARNAHVASNSGALKVAHAPSAAYTLAVQNTLIEDHTGSIDTTSGTHTGTIDDRNDPPTYDCESAVEPDLIPGVLELGPFQLSAGDVGPDALSGADATYLGRRGL
jgi:hypothetical protein